MSANALLLWMSTRGQGSWQQFRAAVEEFRVNDGGLTGGDGEDTSDPYALPLYQELRLNLQRLGHAEFFTKTAGADWRVTPPSLAVIQRANGWLGIVAGARSPKLLQRVNAAVSPEQLQTLVLPASPDQILVTAKDEETLITIAGRVGLLIQSNAPAVLLTCLPPIDSPSVRHSFDLPFGTEWKIERFSEEDLRWRLATREDAVSTLGGLFRFALRHQRYVLLCSRGESFQVSSQVGKFIVLRRCRRRVIRYDVRTQRLSIPASCRPPFLIERALILCSGSLPLYQTVAGRSTLEYCQIPESIARTAAALLRQEPR